MKTSKNGPEVSVWSDELLAQTRFLILDPPLGIWPYLCMKNINGKFGEITLPDLVAEHWNVLDKETNETNYYASCDEMIEAGWAVD